ncbi:MAG: hypothetical protein ACRC0X_04035 [Brevinema sp.]
MQKPFFNADKLQIEVFSLNDNGFEVSQFPFLKQHYSSDLEHNNLSEITPSSEVFLNDDTLQAIDTEKFTFIEPSTPDKISTSKIQDFSNDLDQIFADFDREVSQILSTPKLEHPLEELSDTTLEHPDTILEHSLEELSDTTLEHPDTILEHSLEELSDTTSEHPDTILEHPLEELSDTTLEHTSPEKPTLNHDFDMSLKNFNLQNKKAYGPEITIQVEDTRLASQDIEILDTSIEEETLSPIHTDYEELEEVSTDDIFLNDSYSQDDEILDTSIEEETLSPIHTDYEELEEVSTDDIFLNDSYSQDDEILDTPIAEATLSPIHTDYEELEEVSADDIFLNDSYSQDDEFISSTDIIINDQEDEPSPNNISIDLLQQLNNSIPTASTPTFTDLSLSEVKDIMKEIDELLGALPDEKIEELAHKEFYHNYIKFLDDLGI